MLNNTIRSCKVIFLRKLFLPHVDCWLVKKWEWIILS